MKAEMKTATVQSISYGLSQKGVRDHNERLLLSLLHRHGSATGGDLSKFSGLSVPTVSTILRRLENDGLLERGDLIRGKVGKPSKPLKIAPGGVLSFGAKIGRRSAELVLIDFVGRICKSRKVSYKIPKPDEVFDFLTSAMSEIEGSLSDAEADRICGLGVAAPFEMWNWNDLSGSDARIFEFWEGIDVRQEFTALTDLPVSLINDATAACQAEHVFGRGKEFRDYAYFFIGAFIGGGVVLNNSVFEGRQGNAGALGSMRSVSPLGESKQLIDMASIHLLEARLEEVNIDPSVIWDTPQDWSGISRYVDTWLVQTAQELAKASLSTCSVIDFQAILIDGAFPDSIRADLVDRVRRYILNQDTRGLIRPAIEAGEVGGNARAIGAACGPILSQYLLNTNAGFVIA